MTASDLMIGDYVLVKGRVARVQTLHVNRYFKGDDKIDVVYHETGYSTSMYRIEEIEPMPLTDEIFNDNGFEVRIGAGGLYQFVYSALGTGVDFNIIRYVHQLQHALKICGVNREIVIRKED